MVAQGTDGASRQTPWLGMYSGKPGSHDTFSPLDWPTFELPCEFREIIASHSTPATINMSDPAQWLTTEVDIAGTDSYWHVRPCHASYAMCLMLDAQLRLGHTTSFTVVVPQVGVSGWSRYLKHFRHKSVHDVHVEGLGIVRHWLLRFEAGDAFLPRAQQRDGGRS
jgi:hypothetical protein